MKRGPCLLLAFSLALSGALGAQNLRWTSFANLNDSLRAKRKPLLVFIHADWCNYCKMQEQNTFRDSVLTSALQGDFYCLRLNAEERSELRFLNRTYRYRSHGAGVGRHELAEYLALEQGALSLPATVLLDRDLRVFSRLRGFQSAGDLGKELTRLKGN
jgi:thioredoxin-related protein